MWQDILKIAIIGTERNALALPARNDALGDVLSKLDANARESSLLSAAASIALYERAGQMPAKDSQNLPAAAEADDLPCCNASATRYLSLMLAGEYKELLPEWLAALAAAHQRIPEEQLAAVLQLGKTDKSWREVLAKIIGKRGFWLATQNPAWDYLQDKVNETDWETGTHRERLTLLKKLFQLDAPRAKSLMMTSWKELNADQRAEFLSLFQAALVPADEPFLNAALQDVSKGVRRTAAQLLALLPTSAYVQRNFERAQSVLILEQPKRKKLLVDVGPLRAIIKTLESDMINLKQRQAGEGEQASALRQIVGIVPPGWWCQHFEATPEELLQATRKNEWQDTLLSGWANAARNHKDIAWSKALLNEAALANIYALPESLFQALPVAEQEALLLESLSQSASLLQHTTLQTLLRLMPTQWSHQLSRAILTKLFDELQAVQQREPSKKGKQMTEPVWPLPLFLKQLGLHLRVAFLREAEATIEKKLAAIAPSQAWVDEFDKLLSLLRFRREALAEITKDCL